MTVGWRPRAGWASTNSNRAVPGEDYEPSSGSLSIAPGRSSHTISIPIVDDSEAEPAELLTLELDIGPAPQNHPTDFYFRYFHFRGYIVSNDDNTPPTVTVAHEPVTYLDVPRFQGWPWCALSLSSTSWSRDLTNRIWTSRTAGSFNLAEF